METASHRVPSLKLIILGIHSKGAKTLSLGLALYA